MASSAAVSPAQTSASNCCFNPFKPILWYGHEVKALFSAIPSDQDRAEEMATRVIKALLLITVPIAAGFVIYGTYQAGIVGVVALAALFGSTVNPPRSTPNAIHLPQPPITPSDLEAHSLFSHEPPASTSQLLAVTAISFSEAVLPLPKSSEKSAAASVIVPPAVSANPAISPPFIPSLDLITRAKSAVDAIDGKLSSIFNNLPELHGKLGVDLSAMLLAFAAEFGPLKGHEDCTTIFQQLDHIADLYSKMKSMKQYLFLHLPKMSKKGDALQVPPDGNCFFHCALTWLTLNEEPLRKSGNLQGDLVSHTQLRKSTVDWMKANYHHNEELQFRIISAVGDYREHILKDFDRDITYYSAVISGAMDAEQRIVALEVELKESSILPDYDFGMAQLKFLEMGECQEKIKDAKVAQETLPVTLAKKEQFLKKEVSFNDYFTLIEQPHFFASGAEAYAFSEMHKVRVFVKEKKNGVLQPENVDAKINFNKYPAAPCLTLIYENGDHFNLSIE